MRAMPTSLSTRSLSRKRLVLLTYDLKHKEDLEERQIISAKLSLFQLGVWAPEQGLQEE